MVEFQSPVVPPEKPRGGLYSRVVNLPLIRAIAKRLNLSTTPSNERPPLETLQRVEENFTPPTPPTRDPLRGRYKERPQPTAENYAAAATYTPLVNPEDASDSRYSLYSTTEEQLLAAPNPDLVTLLHQADERISYFAPQPSVSHRDANLRPNADGRLPMRGSVGEYEFLELVTTPLTQQLFIELKNQLAQELGKTVEQINGLPTEELSKLLNGRFAFRGIACSVNGPLIDERRGTLVKDIRQILADGGEKVEEGANVGGMHIDPKTGQPELLHHVNKGFIEGPDRIEINYPREVGRIFPALLVYDRRQLTPVPNTPYANALPQTPEGRRTVIERAYILPRATS